MHDIWWCKEEILISIGLIQILILDLDPDYWISLYAFNFWPNDSNCFILVSNERFCWVLHFLSQGLWGLIMLWADMSITTQNCSFSYYSETKGDREILMVLTVSISGMRNLNMRSVLFHEVSIVPKWAISCAQLPKNH